MKKLSKWVYAAVCGFFTTLIAACYGPYLDIDAHFYANLKDSNGDPIEGLQLTSIDAGTGVTNATRTSDTNGDISFEVRKSDYYEVLTNRLIIEDVDGTNNGGVFSTYTTNAVSDQYASFDIVMKKTNE